MIIKLNLCLTDTIKSGRLVQKATLKKKKNTLTPILSKSIGLLSDYSWSGLVTCKYSDSAAFPISPPLCIIVTLHCDRVSSHTVGLVSESCQVSFSHA